MAGYVAAYRIGMLVSGAGVIGLTAWLEAQGLRQGGGVADRLCRGRALVLVGLLAVLAAREPDGRVDADGVAARAGSDALARVLCDGARGLRRVPVARCGARRAGVRGALQAVRRAGRRHDRAVRAERRSATTRPPTRRSSRAWGWPRCWSAALPAGRWRGRCRSPTALWLGAILQMVSNLAFVWLWFQPAERLGADGGHRDREFHRRHRHGDLRRLHLRAVRQSPAHRDAVRAAVRARLNGPHVPVLGHAASWSTPSAGRCSFSRRLQRRCRRWRCWPGCSGAGISRHWMLSAVRGRSVFPSGGR